MARAPTGPAVESRWLRMRDGVRIAVDVMRPSAVATSLPAVLTMSRYWRSFVLRGPQPRGRAPFGPRSPIGEFLLARGYAVVIADARGTGASDGVWPHPWSNDEVEDFGEVAAWVAAQPWSNGRVGATGISYEGTTAMLLGATGQPAVQAVAARSFEWDLLADVVRPGGVLNEAFLAAWSDSVADLDRNKPPALFGTIGKLMVKGVRPVDEDPKGEELARIVSARNNPNVLGALRAAECREDGYGGQGETLDDLSVQARLPALRENAVPTQLWASWRDGTTADSALEMWKQIPSVRELRIGAWAHDGEKHASPFREGGKPDPVRGSQWEAIADFLGGPLQRGDVAQGERTLHYFTMGAERWQRTTTWPPPGLAPLALHLHPGGVLREEAAAAGETRWTVDPRSSTGTKNRWHGQMARPIRYGNRAKATRELPRWRWEALPQATEITGHVEAHLCLRCSTPDLSLFAYLDLVDPQGRLHYLTEAILRCAFRRSDAGFCRADLQPLEPGARTPITLRFLPTSVEIPAGWSLQLSLAGADAETFERIPADATPDVTVEHGPEAPSRLVLPVQR